MAVAHNSNRTSGGGNGSSKYDHDGPGGIVPPSRRYVFSLFYCYENTPKTVPQTRTATATTTITSCQSPVTHCLPTQTQTVAAADTVTARNSSRASGGGSSTTDGGLMGNAPEPVGILFICYDSIAKTTTIACRSPPANTNTNGGGSGNRNRGHYRPTPRRHPSPIACHSPTPTQSLAPTAAAWPRYNTTHHHADHAIARRPRPSSIAATGPAVAAAAAVVSGKMEYCCHILWPLITAARCRQR